MSPSEIEAERRHSLELRALFPDAYALIEPFFDPANSWGGSTHEHLAIRTLHDEYPQLTDSDVYVIVATAKRVIAEQRRVARQKV